jgi:CRISPR/Cas system endoribonuclease Cas6 (RAMP superfamily)
MVELFELAQEDLELTELTIRDKALKEPAIKAKWGAIRFAEEAKLEKLERIKEQLIDKFTEEFGHDLNMKRFEINAAVLKKDEIKRIDKAVNIQKQVISFVHEMIKTIYGFGFSVKNAIDILKLET